MGTGFGPFADPDFIDSSTSNILLAIILTVCLVGYIVTKLKDKHKNKK